MTENIDESIVDFLDLINFTLSNKFEDKWRHRFSSSFIKLFQLKLLECMDSQKPIKRSTLFTYLTKRCKYSEEQVENFFKAIEIEIYDPLIQK
jgi:hypothetical protein